jgi:hypothetical protein
MPDIKHESRFDPVGLPICRGFCYTLHREAKSALPENREWRTSWLVISNNTKCICVPSRQRITKSASKASVTSRPLFAATAVLKPIVPITSVHPRNWHDKLWGHIFNSKVGLSVFFMIREK